MKIKQLLKNRTFIGIACIVLSILLFFGIGPMLLGQSAKQIQITRVSKSIPKNTKITDDMLETVKIGGYNLPSDVVQNRTNIVGKYSNMQMLPGDYILKSKLSAKPLGADEYLTKLDGKKVAVSISIKSFAAGLSGKLETGDIISLVAANYGDMKETIMPANLQYVKVLAATTETGNDSDRSSLQKDKNSTSEKDNLPSTLTLLVTPEQAKSLVDYETNGILHASLVYRGSNGNAQKFLDIQDKYLKEESTTNEQ
jgi:pilus assembly protein CpaB